jgi:hypothetical protein
VFTPIPPRPEPAPADEGPQTTDASTRERQQKSRPPRTGFIVGACVGLADSLKGLVRQEEGGLLFTLGYVGTGVVLFGLIGMLIGYAVERSQARRRDERNR